MRILLLCNKLPYPANDGSSIAISKMIEGFVEEGAQVSVLSLNTIKHFKDPVKIPQKIRESVDFTIVDVNTNPTSRKAFVNLFQKLPFHVSRFYQANVAKKLVHILKESDFDVVQIEGLFMMPYAHLIKKHSKAKIALRTHNIEHRIWERAIESSSKPALKAFLKMQTRKLKRYEWFCAGQADAIVAISEKDEAYFQILNPLSITIPCGIEQTDANHNISNQHFFHLGAMDWFPNQQGIDWLVKKVWPIVFAANNTLTLHLAGRAMSEKLLGMKAEGIIVHGEIDDASNFRKNHGIMLVPLLAGSGIRIKIIEGLAEGIPVISTDIGAEGIPAKHEKEIIYANSAQDFASAMLQLANNAELCQQIGKNAAILAEQNYLNKNLANRLMAFYSSAW